ncbi:MAG: isoleucine--tRNA ligase [Candidatus Paceibacterota bacterium]
MPKITNFNQPPALPELEEQVLKFWQEDHTFQKSVEQRSAENSYVFYDGPPFATGMPHYGHLLASTTKDVVPRYQTMKGKRVERVWGWDCHGLPIENMIEQQLKIQGGKKGIEELGIDVFNDACRTEVLRLDKEWEKIIGRLGRWVDFEHSYKTMDKNYMESVWWGFKELYEKGLVYQGKKVILYCPRCATPLSNFEIAMDNSYLDVTENSTIYKYPVKDQENTFLLAWSTTPWNKLVTPALAVSPNLTYVKVLDKKTNEYYILAEDRLTILDDQHEEIIERYSGKDLEKLSFKPHYDFYAESRQSDEKIGVIIADEFVTAEEGTGIVTLAVYGEDDYRIMQAHGIQLAEHVDEGGKLKSEIKPWAGLDILEVNTMVDEELASRNLIYGHRPQAHSVPVCYRCGTRLYHAPLPAWFINIQQLKPSLIAHNQEINWVPEHLKLGRFQKGLENAPDWNISRSRYWGTPMPIWKGKDKDGQEIIRIIGSIEELQRWAVDAEQVASVEDLHREHLDDIELWVDEVKTIKGQRVPEVFDAWVESGSMPFASRHYPFENKPEFEKNYPAQFISEYIAQTRAWFYTMHALSVGIFDSPAFENVLTTGTILAEDGTKMSKSKKNFPDPILLINKYGSDSLRLYLMSSTVMKSENLSFNEKEVADIRRKTFVIWWNILSFYQTFAQQQSIAKPTEPDHVLDRWILSKLETLVTETTQQMDAYDLVRASRGLMEFVSDLSTWYLRLSRERIKADDNQEVSQVFGYVLYALAQLFAPFAPFFAELVHHNLVDDQSSIHLTSWPKFDEKLQDSQLEADMETVRKVVELGHAFRKDREMKVRQPLQSVIISLPEGQVINLGQYDELIKQELNVKLVKWQNSQTSEFSVTLDLALTPELKAEGEAREIMRTIQNLRRKAGLTVDQPARMSLPTWPEEWQAEIEAKTTTTLIKGEQTKLLGLD